MYETFSSKDFYLISSRDLPKFVFCVELLSKSVQRCLPFVFVSLLFIENKVFLWNLPLLSLISIITFCHPTNKLINHHFVFTVQQKPRILVTSFGYPSKRNTHRRPVGDSRLQTYRVRWILGPDVRQTFRVLQETLTKTRTQFFPDLKNSPDEDTRTNVSLNSLHRFLYRNERQSSKRESVNKETQFHKSKSLQEKVLFF